MKACAKRPKEAKKEGENDDWLPTLPDFKRGASTISQQLAKNLYLSSRRSFFRKGQEAMLTVFLERTLTKRRILELYLNVIEWGDGIYGAEAAAQHYFHKPASALSANEAAFLSAMIPNPRTVFNPQVNPRRAATLLKGSSCGRRMCGCRDCVSDGMGSLLTLCCLPSTVYRLRSAVGGLAVGGRRSAVYDRVQNVPANKKRPRARRGLYQDSIANLLNRELLSRSNYRANSPAI